MRCLFQQKESGAEHATDDGMTETPLCIHCDWILQYMEKIESGDSVMESGRGVGDGASFCRDGQGMDWKRRINEKFLSCLLVSSGRDRNLFECDCRQGQVGGVFCWLSFQVFARHFYCVRLCMNNHIFTTMKTNAAMNAHSSGGRNLVRMKNTPIASPNASMIWQIKMMMAQARPRMK